MCHVIKMERTTAECLPEVKISRVYRNDPRNTHEFILTNNRSVRDAPNQPPTALKIFAFVLFCFVLFCFVYQSNGFSDITLRAETARRTLPVSSGLHSS